MFCSYQKGRLISKGSAHIKRVGSYQKGRLISKGSAHIKRVGSYQKSRLYRGGRFFQTDNIILIF